MQQGADSRKLNTGGWELGRTRNKREASAHVGSIAVLMMMMSYTVGHGLVTSGNLQA